MTKPRPPFFVELYRTDEMRKRKDRGTGETYETWAYQWRWRKVAPNGRILAVAGEGYFNRADCLKGLERATPGYHFNLAGDELWSEHLGDADAAYAIEVREIA